MKNFTKKLIIGSMLTMLSTNLLAVRENGGRLAPMAVKIHFTSHGAGVDSDLRIKVLEEIHNTWVKYEVFEMKESKKQGREGETTICVESSSFSKIHKLMLRLEAIVEDSASVQTQVQKVLACGKIIVRRNI